MVREVAPPISEYPRRYVTSLHANPRGMRQAMDEPSGILAPLPRAWCGRTQLMTKELRVLSLGAGVQSSTLLLLSIQGELPRLDAAIFADTGWEPDPVYAHLAWLETQAQMAGIPLLRVSVGNIRADALRSTVRGRVSDRTRWASLPYFVDPKEGPAHGMLRRQCTREYKLDPIK